MSAHKEKQNKNEAVMPAAGIYYAAETEHGWAVALNGRIVLREDGEQTSAEGIARMLNTFVEAEDFLADFQ
jgi:hypothetical protein